MLKYIIVIVIFLKKCVKVLHNTFQRMKFTNSICLKIKNMRERFNQTFSFIITGL